MLTCLTARIHGGKKLSYHNKRNFLFTYYIYGVLSKTICYPDGYLLYYVCAGFISCIVGMFCVGLDIRSMWCTLSGICSYNRMVMYYRVNVLNIIFIIKREAFSIKGKITIKSNQNVKRWKLIQGFYDR